ncbi:MAG: hypothetical protein IKM43_00490 [Clostridia bacterium]|nr:hypothetical protein [Clostridia bacterium]
MKLLKSNEIIQVVQQKAMYQKVMVLYDDFASDIQINDIIQQMKGSCIFNKIHIKDAEPEIYNGYKLILYFCGVDSILHRKFDASEFVNIYLPQDKGILPYFVGLDNKIEDKQNYLLISNQMADVYALASLYFNRFFNYMQDLLYFQYSDKNFEFVDNEITMYRIIETLNNTTKDLEFVDIKLIKEIGLSYEDLIYVDFLLISAFKVVITSVSNHTLGLVDVYKSFKEDYAGVDRVYAMLGNRSLMNLVELNYNFLNNACEKTKTKILDLLPTNKIDKDRLIQIIDKIKTYAKQSDDLIGYLYLYDVFGS